MRRLTNPFVRNPSCVLCLPFYRYGAEQAKVWDLSGNNNHGTIYGAGPEIHPIPLGVELVTNGGMEDGDPPTGWSTYNTPEVFERSSVQSHSGAYSCHINDSSPDYGGFSTGVSYSPGKRYKISFWYYIMSGWLGVNTGSDPAHQFYYSEMFLWRYAEEVIVASSQDFRLAFHNASTSSAAEFYIDDVSIQEVVGYESLGWGFDGVDDYIEVPHSSSLSISDNISILFWVRPQYRDGAPYGGFGKLSDVSDATFACYILSRSSNPRGIIFWANAGGAWTWVSSDFYLVDYGYLNKWICACWEYNSSIGGQLYINGEPQGSRAGSGILATNSQPITIGLLHGYTGSSFGEFLLFNRRLSPQEIKDYYELTRHRYGV